MTLIECFTDSHVDNISACLRLKPEKTVLIGNGEKMAEAAERYRRLLRQRQQDTRIILQDVQGKNFAQICAVLGKLICGETECVINLTGGDERVIMAVGAVLEKLDCVSMEHIRVEKYDRDLDAVVDCMHDDRPLPGEPVNLTVKELIELHGGCLHPESYQPPADFGHRDLDGLWSIVSAAPREWNRAIGVLNELESRSGAKQGGQINLEALRSKVSDYVQKEYTVRKLLDKLHQHGVIEDRSSWDVLKYTYCSPILRYCTQKAGNVLEVKTLTEGRGVLENGAPLFHDALMSVSIDWDAVIHDPAKRIPETRNEIDVVFMHGTVPLFVSCKNGTVGEEELYKLHTVAGWFGGPYARKMLIATDLNQKSPAATRAFVQRAWDMDILLVTDAAELSKEEWQEIFRKAVE